MQGAGGTQLARTDYELLHSTLRVLYSPLKRSRPRTWTLKDLEEISSLEQPLLGSLAPSSELWRSSWVAEGHKGGSWQQVLVLSLSHKGKFLSVVPLPSPGHKHHRARNVWLLSWRALSFLTQAPLLPCLEEFIYDSRDTP